MFIRLTESRKDDKGNNVYKGVLVNMNEVRYVQEPMKSVHTYLCLGDNKFMFVKESLEEIEKKMLTPL